MGSVRVGNCVHRTVSGRSHGLSRSPGGADSRVTGRDNEIERCFGGLDRGVGVDNHRGRGRPLASRHKRSVATDKWLVCVAVRPCKLPARGVVAEEIRRDSRFGLAPGRCGRADLCCRACGAENMASQLIRNGINHFLAAQIDILVCPNRGVVLRQEGMDGAA
jgi:hypothetical protein